MQNTSKSFWTIPSTTAPTPSCADCRMSTAQHLIPSELLWSGVGVILSFVASIGSSLQTIDLTPSLRLNMLLNQPTNQTCSSSAYRDPTKTPSPRKDFAIVQAFSVQASQIPRANMGCKLNRTCQWDWSIQAASWICFQVPAYPASMQLWRWMYPGSSPKRKGTMTAIRIQTWWPPATSLSWGF